MKRSNALITISRNLLLGILVLSSTVTAVAAQKTTTITAQLQVVLDDEACKNIIDQLSGLHGTLEQMLSKEINNKTKNLLIKNVSLYMLKICGFEIVKHAKVQEPLIKTCIALCDAIALFIEEVLHNAHTRSTQVAFLKDKAIETCQEIKQVIIASKAQVSLTGGASLKNVDRYYNLIAADLATVIKLHPAFSLGTFTCTVNELDKTLNPYTKRFMELFKQSLAKNLSGEDIDHLVALIQSPVYTKIKSHVPGLVQVCLDTISPETKDQTEGMLTEFWSKTQNSIVNGLHKLKDRLSKPA